MKKTMEFFFHSHFLKKATYLSRPHYLMAENQVVITLYIKIMIIGKITGLLLKTRLPPDPT